MKPYLTEKTYRLATGSQPVYTFKVEKKVTADQIRLLVKLAYGKDVTAVRFVSAGGRQGNRRAVVRLRDKQTIPGFEVEEKK